MKAVLTVKVAEGLAQWAWGDGEPVSSYTLIGGSQHTIKNPTAGYLSAIASAVKAGSLVLLEADDDAKKALYSAVTTREADVEFNAAVEDAAVKAWREAEDAIVQEEMAAALDAVKNEMGEGADPEDVLSVAASRAKAIAQGDREGEVREAAAAAASKTAEALAKKGYGG